jgi:Polyketide cyclase / dehydrase and lipid transport
MGKATESIHVATSLAEAWDLYFDRARWASWADGFRAIEADNGYPEVGGTLRWRSVSAGRGVVTEHVLEHEPRNRHRIRFSDPQSSGDLLTELAIEGDGVRVTLTTAYRLAQRGPFAWLTDRLFVRSQVRRSLARSLARFKREAEDRLDR